MTEDDTSASTVLTPKKPSLTRQAIAQHALRKSIAASSIPVRTPSEDRPSYSATYLSELKSSTPSTPKDIGALLDLDDDAVALTTTTRPKAIDIASKFGPLLPSSTNASIPTDAEIREKKARRARLAKEQKYAAPHTSDSEDPDTPPEATNNNDSDLQDSEDEFRSNANTISLAPRPSHKHAETRLVRDDEDIMEDFDTFTSTTAPLTLGRKAERAARAKRKDEMRTMIAEAEGGSSSSDSSDSERERTAAYEAAQTRKGMDGLRLGEEEERERARERTPPRITPLPSLAGCLERLRAMLVGLEKGRAEKMREMENVGREIRDIEVREVEVQKGLVEVGERYEKLRREAGIQINGAGAEMGMGAMRGLESLGGTPLRGTPRVGTPMGGRGLESFGATPVGSGGEGSGGD